MPVLIINRLTFVKRAPYYLGKFCKLNHLSHFICHAR